MTQTQINNSTTRISRPSVSVIGLGAMGQALARTFLERGHPLTVWNRSPQRAAALVEDSATLAPDVRAAVLASDLTVICLLDQAAVRGVLEPLGGDLRGRTVVNLTSATPELARDAAEWAAERGLRYLNGAIMVPTPLIGTEDAFFLYSGSPEVFEEHRSTLEALGGESDFLGTDPGRAALFDVGMLDLYFVGMAGYLHAQALMGEDGVTAEAFRPYAERVVSVLQATIPGLAADVDAHSYPGDEDTLTMESVALDHIVSTSAARGIDTTIPRTVHALTLQAIRDGHGSDGFSRVIEQLRSPGR